MFLTPIRAKRLIPPAGFGGSLRVDLSHPLANGLIACYVPGVSRGINLVGASGDLAIPGIAYQNFVNTVEGPSYESSSGEGGLQGVAPPAFLGGTTSIFWRGRVGTATSIGGNHLLGIAYSNPEVSPYVFSSVGVDQFTGNGQVTWNTGGSLMLGTAVALTSNAINSLVGTFKPGGNATLYKSGALVGSSGFGASVPSSAATTTICIQSNTATLNRAMDGSTLIGCIWNRELSANEVATLDADPYCFLVSPEGEMPALYVAPASPIVSRQYIASPGVYVSETGTRSYMVAPGVYVTERISAVTAPATQYAAFSLPQHSLSQVIQKMVGY